MPENKTTEPVCRDWSIFIIDVLKQFIDESKKSEETTEKVEQTTD